MLLKCIAIDDEPLALELIKTYVAKMPGLNLVQTFDDAISGGEFLRNNAVDLLFIDINMPDITGIELVHSLENKPLVIFTTAYKNFAYEGFQLEAVDYLLKPIDFTRFAKAVKKAFNFYSGSQTLQPTSKESLFVRSEYKMLRIELDDIEYIEGLEDYIKIHLINARPVLTLMTLKAIIEKLPVDKFIRIHRSYIIPIAKVKAIVNKKVLLASSRELPISDSYIDFIKRWTNK